MHNNSNYLGWDNLFPQPSNGWQTLLVLPLLGKLHYRAVTFIQLIFAVTHPITLGFKRNTCAIATGKLKVRAAETSFKEMKSYSPIYLESVRSLAVSSGPQTPAGTCQDFLPTGQIKEPLYVATTSSVEMSLMVQLLLLLENEISVFLYPFQYGLQWEKLFILWKG